MGCGDHWPRCDGEWFPPLDLPTLIEISHRWAAALVSALVFAVAVVACVGIGASPRCGTPPSSRDSCWWCRSFWARSPSSWSSRPGSSSPTSPTRWCSWRRSSSIGLAGQTRRFARPSRTGAASRRPRAGAGTAALGFVVILFGAQVANFDAGLLCLGFPLCNGSALPPDGDLAAGCTGATGPSRCGFLVVLGLLVSRLRRSRAMETAAVRRWATIVLGATLVQIAVAAAMILHLLPTGLRALHLLVGTADLGRAGRAGVLLRAHAAEGRRSAVGKPKQPSVLAADLVTLTKPRIISLLLVTTIAPMFITPAGLPSATAGALGGGRRLPDGGRRQRHQHVVRPGHRHPDVAGRSCARFPPAGSAPAAGLAFGHRARPRWRSPSSGTRSIRSAPGSRSAGSCSTSSSTPSGSSARARRTS